MRTIPARRRPTRTALTAVTALALVLAGCSKGTDRAATDAAPVAVEAPTSAPLEVPADVPPVVATATATATATPTATAAATATAAPRRALPPPYDVRLVQRQLTAQRYYVGPIDGERGASMRSAVMAFQKVNGLGADGIVGKGTLAALKAPRKPVLRGGSGPANRVEIDLSRQVLYVVQGGALARVLPVSSGNGARYLQKSGGVATALTPVGWFKVQRRIIGERKADLGTLYDPQYFYKGWAIHGSNSVPAYPASHGCVRVTRTDAKWLLGQIGIGTTIYLYGGRHTFTAGSSAPGTDAPSGDTAPPPSPKPTASPSPSPRPTSSPRPSSTPQPTASSKPSASATPSPRG